ncbi:MULTISPECIES: hypothetical protein [Phaeobacter]|uniref:hypothetical protein n=1 Tax=Phaeobacter TaxID=302485 RepID=UPI000F4C5059|nr:hypothetical protein [Phaeobacter inhibens]
MSLREYDLITRAGITAKKDAIAVQRVLNQELSTLVSYAFHKPEKMPDFTKVNGARTTRKSNPKRDVAQLRAAFIGMHAKGKKGR